MRDARDLQFLKADFPIVVTLLGIVTASKDSQSLNASFPILVTLSGIEIEASEEQ